MVLNKLDRFSILVELDKLKPELQSLYKISRIGLFGSFARDEAGDKSDIDIVVEMLDPDLFYLVHIKDILEKHFNRSVDIVHYRETMNPFLKRRIECEAIYA